MQDMHSTCHAQIGPWRFALLPTNHFRQWFSFGNESHRNRVHAVPRVFGREPFAFEDVPEVSSAVGTDDFGAAPIDIGDTFDALGKMFVEAGPAAAAVELVFRVIDGQVALTANERAVVLVVGVFAGVRVLGPLMMNHVAFGVVEWIILRHITYRSYRACFMGLLSLYILRSMAISATRPLPAARVRAQFRCSFGRNGLNSRWFEAVVRASQLPKETLVSRIIPLLFVAILCLSVDSLFAQSETVNGDAARGRELFLHQWTPGDALSPHGDGLGPMFNGKSCVECHSLGGVGGSGESKRNAQFLSFLPESGKFTDDAIKSFLGRLKKMHPDFVDDKDQFSFGVLLHRQSTTPEYAEVHDEVTTPLASNFDSRLRIRRMLSKRNIRPVDALPLKLVTYQDELQYALAERNPPQLFGLNDIDRLITDEDRQKLVDAQTKSRTGVSGRMAGKFGWRGQMRNLDLFIKGACATELGLQVHEFEQTKDPLRQEYSLKGNDLSQQQVGDLIRYVRSFDMPRQVLPDDPLELEAIAEGEKLFTTVGCAECHVQDVGRVSGVYSDFLLHNMGTQFEDPIPAEPIETFTEQSRMDVITSYHGMRRRVVTTELVRSMEVGPDQHTEYKTPPLWGVADSAPYMHDGRATTLRAAIEWHGGEAYSSFRRFSLLSEEKQFSLLKFLETLKAPQTAEEAPRELIDDVASIAAP